MYLKKLKYKKHMEIYSVNFNETKSYDYNILKIYKIRYQFLNKLPNELI